MIRSALAAFLGAAFGALTYHPAQDRFLDVSAAAAPLYALLFVATAAALLCLFVMACRDPVHVVIAEPFDDGGFCASLREIRDELAAQRSACSVATERVRWRFSKAAHRNPRSGRIEMRDMLTRIDPGPETRRTPAVGN